MIQQALLLAAICAGAMPAALAAGFAAPASTAARPAPAAAQGRLTAVATSAGRWVAVGPWGRILHSADGTHWAQAPVPVSTDLVAISMPDARHAWAVGHEGIVLHSDDAGQHWAKQLDAARLRSSASATYARMRAAGEVDAAAAQGELERLASLGDGMPLLDVLFLNAREGFVVGGFNLALHTTDGGQTWQPLGERLANPEGLHLYGLAAAGKDVYVVGERGLARRWQPERGQFEVLTLPYDGTLFGVLAFGATVLAFGLEGTVLRSDDRGQHWTHQALPSRASLTAGARLPDGTLVLSSQAGLLWVSRDGGLTFTVATPALPGPAFGIAPLGKDSLLIAGPTGLQPAALGRTGN